MAKLKSFALATILLLTAGCAYRFTNTAIRPPAGIRSVAVEAIYDTSREVLPHELLWEALQRSFAENGRIALTSQENADALLRAQITNAFTTPYDTPDEEQTPGGKTLSEPEVEKGRVYNPGDFPRLPRAGIWTKKELIGYTVLVELWDLRTRKLLFKRTYTGSDYFQSVLPETPTPYTPGTAPGTQISMQYLIFEESFNTKFKQIAETIADKVVQDIYF